MNNAPSQGPDTPTFARSKKARHILALLLLVAYAVAAVWLYRECVEVLSIDTAGIKSSQETCSPPTLTSGTVLIFLAVVGALLWPDLSEISVLGVGVKRQAERAHELAENTREDLRDLRSVVLTQQTQIETNTVSSAANNIFISGLNSPALDSEQEQILKYQADLIRQNQGNAQNPAAREPQVSSYAEVALRLLASFQELSDVLDLHATRGRGRPTIESAIRREAQEKFLEQHFNAFRSAQAVRNDVAHGKRPDRQNIADALLVLEDLVPAAKDQIARATSGDE